jgi:predicted flap endonuclease-1-like 5' DNA nuclease
MFFNVGESELIFSIVGLAIGIVIAIIRARYWKERITEHEENNESLNKANKNKEAKLKDLHATLQEYKANIEKLGARAREQIIKRDEAINQLKEQVNTLDGQFKAMTVRARKAQTYTEELENSLKIKETELQSLQSRSQEQETTITQMRSQATQTQEQIHEMTNQIEERDKTINQLQEAVNNRDNEIQEWKTHSENTQTKILEMETRYNKKEQDIATLETRIRSMQDNLTIISGIGPKVSGILRKTGITTFAKLAALNTKKIKKILKTENPQLLQLVDPTTWQKQAKLASKEQWEALTILQDSLKEKRSTLTDELVDMETNQITTNNPTQN